MVSTMKEISILFLGLAVALAQSGAKKQPYTTWSDFGGAMDSMQYSSLKQITKSNVNKLELAWTYKTPGRRFPFSPLVVDRVMYVIGIGGAIDAIDASTGKQIWSHPLD